MNTSEKNVYVASLSDYNAGILHGRWIECDGKTADEIGDEVKEILDTSIAAKRYGDIAEEYAIHDHEGFGELVGEYTSITELGEIIEALESADDENALLEYADSYGYDIREAAERFSDAYYGQYDSETDFAWAYIDDTGLFYDVPDFLQSYFDIDRYARDLFFGFTMTESGHVFLDNC